jgi:hypothetical protein
MAKYHLAIVSQQRNLDSEEFPHSPLSGDSEDMHPIPSKKIVMVDLTVNDQPELLVQPCQSKFDRRTLTFLVHPHIQSSFPCGSSCHASKNTGAIRCFECH